MSPKILLVASILGLVVGVPPPPQIRADDSVEASDRTVASLVCYEYPDGKGDSVKLITSTDDLRPYNFYKRAASCCFTGVWVLYESINFNRGYLKGLSFFGFGEPAFCTNLDGRMYKKAASARLVSDPRGIAIDSLSLFQGEFFNGFHTFIQTPFVPFIDHSPTGLSAVVTGFASWTVYTSTQGAGECACLRPRPGGVPGFYTDRYLLGHMAGRIVSVRKNCYCPRSFEPQQKP